MGTGGSRAYQDARRETLAALAELTENQRAMVVTYNDRSRAVTGGMRPVGERLRDEVGEALATVIPFGPTNHAGALLAALRTRADVIVVVTDAGDPAPRGGSLTVVTERAAGRTLHFVRVAARPDGEDDQWMRRPRHGHRRDIPSRRAPTVSSEPGPSTGDPRRPSPMPPPTRRRRERRSAHAERSSFIVPTSSLTASTEWVNAVCSSSVSSSSIIRLTPPSPRITGTPT